MLFHTKGFNAAMNYRGRHCVYSIAPDGAGGNNYYTHWVLHRGAFFQFLFRCIYYYGSNESTGEETGKTHLCAVCGNASPTEMFEYYYHKAACIISWSAIF